MAYVCCFELSRSGCGRKGDTTICISHICQHIYIDMWLCTCKSLAHLHYVGLAYTCVDIAEVAARWFQISYEFACRMCHTVIGVSLVGKHPNLEFVHSPLILRGVDLSDIGTCQHWVVGRIDIDIQLGMLVGGMVVENASTQQHRCDAA